jgi:hypothetical protein
MIAMAKQILYIGLACLLLPAGLAMAQALEPRRWSHLPVGANFAGVGYAYSDVDIFLDPALELEDVRGDIHTTLISYTRVLDVFGKSGRINFLVTYSVGRWDGLLQGAPASTRRRGFNDPRMRFAVNLLGSPAQRGAAFTPVPANTIVGVALDITAPLGEYLEERLINLGANRWIIRPQIGVVHNWDKWAAELTTSAWFFTDNDDFDVDKTREQDPLVSIQSHLIYTFRPGLWASLSAAYGGGARSTIDGVQANDQIGNVLVSVALGVPINRRQGFKIAYIHGETTKNTGSDYESVPAVGMSTYFPRVIGSV